MDKLRLVHQQGGIDCSYIRKWIPVGGCLSSNSLTVMTYNVLSNSCLTKYPQFYSYADRKHLEWNTRWKTLLGEITRTHPDVLALQEVDQCHLQDYFTDKLKNIGYKLKYKKNTGDCEFGCLLAWKTDHLILEEYQDVEYSEITPGEYCGLNVAQIGCFSSAESPMCKLCLTNTHIHFNMNRGDIKLAQILHIIGKVENMTRQMSIPVIMCGDYNLYPFSPIYKLIRDGTATMNPHGRQELSDPDFPCSPSPISNTFSHNLRLQSVYEPISSRISCFTHNEGKLVDYMWYSPHSNDNNWKLTPVYYLEVPKREEVILGGGIPSLSHPSDHFPLIAVFDWTVK